MMKTIYLVWLISLSVVEFAFSQLTLPTGFVRTKVASGINGPTVMAMAPDGRIFVAEKSGRLKVIKNGQVLPTPFVQLTVAATGERGLIGITLDPNFPTNNFLYLYYTVPGTPIHNRVSRFTANGDVAVIGSEVIVLELDPLSSATNHNGGALAFGPDGKLYVAIGDNAKGINAQNLDVFHGKILRVNADGSAPTDNPFLTGSEKRKRVWAYGVRNPFTFAFQPGTGKFYVNDVGLVSWEEINDATQGGLNFGWPTEEGVVANHLYTNPVYAYPHGTGDGKGCAITGGTFFNPDSTDFPRAYYGKYFFNEYCENWINLIDPDEPLAGASPFALSVANHPVAIYTGVDGNLYYLGRNEDAVFKISYNNPSAPYIIEQPKSKEIAEGGSISFSVKAAGSRPHAYQWQKDGVDLSGVNSSTFSILNAEEDRKGLYRVIVSNGVGKDTSSYAELSIDPINDSPSISISSPLDSSSYAAGSTISFSALATDEEDGLMPDAAFDWQVRFYKENQIQSHQDFLHVKVGEFSVPNQGENLHEGWYSILARVTDSGGSVAEDSVSIFPRTSKIYFSTEPSGLQLKLDNKTITTPLSDITVEGMLRSVEALTPQSLNGTEYIFDYWEPGGDAIKSILVPPGESFYTAHFAAVTGVKPDQLNSIEIYPNPTEKQMISVKIYSSSRQSSSIKIIDTFSRLRSAISVNLEIGDNAFPLSIEKLNPGIYFVSVEVNQDRRIKKLLIR